MKYRKKPVIVDAYQTDRELDIETLEGTMHASVGDFIITGVRGEQYPCKPDIFEQTYDKADLPTESTFAWVSVAEHKPKTNYVVIGVKKIDDDFWDMYLCTYDSSNGWKDMDGYSVHGITHWMAIIPPEVTNHDTSRRHN